MRHVLVKLALIGFLCRALVPAGFMPAPISDGGPIRFCHGGAAGALLSALLEQRADARTSAHAQHHGEAHDQRDGLDAPLDHNGGHDHEQNANHEGWERCPIGAAFALAALSSDFSLPLLPLENAVAQSEAAVPVPRLSAAHYHARAPPVV